MHTLHGIRFLSVARIDGMQLGLDARWLDVRGLGLMIGVQLSIPGKEMVMEGMKQGLLFNCTHDTVLRFLPPYIITEKEIDKAITGLKKVFKTVK